MKMGKRKIILAALVVTLGLAVYLNVQFSNAGGGLTATGALDAGKSLGDAQLVNGTTAEGDPADTDAAASGAYFAEARQNRQKARQEALDVLKDVINNVKADEASKKDAVSKSALIASQADTEAKIENLVKAKGFKDCVAVLGDADANVVVKTEKDLIRNQQTLRDRSQLLNAARNGDEEAIENLTLDDMDTYSAISKRIHNEDVFTLVDTYFMPYGVECDQYSVLGEIVDFNFVKNIVTDEEICVMIVSCNDLQFDICINRADLYGEPAVGRRFKGTIWMQGYINFP